MCEGDVQNSVIAETNFFYFRILCDTNLLVFLKLKVGSHKALDISEISFFYVNIFVFEKKNFIIAIL